MARAVPRFSRFQLAISFWILFWGNPWVRPRCGLVRRGFALGVPWVRPGCALGAPWVRPRCALGAP
jgi:hypothetical protein